MYVCTSLEFLVNGSPPKMLDIAKSNLQVNRSHDVRVLNNILCDHDPKVKGQIMYFLVNASPPYNDATTRLAKR